MRSVRGLFHTLGRPSERGAEADVISRDARRTALQLALVALASYASGQAITRYFHNASAETGGMWAVMSAVVVLQQSHAQPLPKAGRQIVATLVGALIGAAYLSTLDFTALGLGLAVFLAVIGCHALRVSAESSLAALSVGVVMVVSSMHPDLHPIQSAALRFTEACIGTVMAVLALHLWPAGGAD